MKKDKKKTLVLLDAHAILHRAYHAIPNFFSPKGEPTGAIYGFCTFILKIKKDLNPDFVVACFDLPDKTHRHEVYEEYKAGRPKIDDELVFQLESSKKVCAAMNIPIYSSSGFEADDMLGTIVEQLKDKKDIEIIIASGDMDTMQLIKDNVRVYTLKKGIQDSIIYDKNTVIERFGFAPEFLIDFKGLRGDPSDNIVGISGVGEKTAEVLIKNFGDLENIFKKLKEKKNNGKISELKKIGISEKMLERILEGEDEAIFSKTLATIRRDSPIFFNLPKENWLSGMKKNDVLSLLSELDFRSLRQKFIDAFGFANEETAIFDEELKEIQVMYWLIDSNKTKGTVDEIFSYLQVKDLKEAKNKMLEIINSQGLGFLWGEVEKPLLSITDKMSSDGIMIDRNFLMELSSEYTKRIKKLEGEICKIAGIDFNVSSPKQLSEVLFDKLELKIKGQKKNKSGSFSTKESELVKLKDQNPIIDKILEYREYSKLLSTYVEAIISFLDKGNRLHPVFIQNGSTTGRMATENPSIQNIPNRTDEGREIRKAFVAPKAKVLVSIDYSQMELRIAAFLSEDKKMIEIFNKNLDVHLSVASQIFNTPMEKVTKEMRNMAKTINFGIMYGMGSLALRQNLKISKEEADEFLRNYFDNFRGLSMYLENIKRETANRGFTETFFGRRRYFPDIKSKLPFIKAQAERMAINAPIQGTEADIIKIAMVEIDKYIVENKLKEKIKMILQVHDELVFEMDKDIFKESSLKIKNIMENVIDPKKTFGVKMVANVSFGNNWAVMEELVF